MVDSYALKNREETSLTAFLCPGKLLLLGAHAGHYGNQS
jgi:hypothetical protein